MQGGRAFKQQLKEHGAFLVPLSSRHGPSAQSGGDSPWTPGTAGQALGFLRRKGRAGKGPWAVDVGLQGQGSRALSFFTGGNGGQTEGHRLREKMVTMGRTVTAGEMVTMEKAVSL